MSHKEITLDGRNPFDAVLIKMVETHRSKSADYAGTEEDKHYVNPYQNFFDVAYQMGLTAGHSVESLIAVKQARLRVLLPRFWKHLSAPRNEPIQDTLLDRAVYSVIAVVLWDINAYEDPFKVEGT